MAGVAGLLLAARFGTGVGAQIYGAGYDLDSIAAVVLGGTLLLGGRGGVGGTIAGVLILGVLDSVFNQMQVDPFFREVLRGVIIIAAVAVYARRQIDPTKSRARFGEKSAGRQARPGSGDHPPGRNGAGDDPRAAPTLEKTQAAGPAQERSRANECRFPRLHRALAALRRMFGGGTGPVFIVLLALLVTMVALNPGFFQPASLMAFLRNAAPLIILAVGQYFVIVSGEFDLSVGSLVGAQVVIAAKLIDGDEARTWPVIVLMLGFGLLVGLVNGLVTTLLKVPSFITTLGMMLVLAGAIRLWTGGAPTGALSESFRQWGRMGIEVPVLRQIPYAALIMVVVAVLAVLLMRAPYGRTLVTTGDNDVAAGFAGARVWQVRTIAFVLSGLLATVAGILIGGFAGVTAQVGQGMEFTAITAVVLGGVVLGGGRGWVIGAMAGALTYRLLERLLVQLDMPSTLNPTIQGVIIILALAYGSRQIWGRRRRRAAQPAPTRPEPAGGP